MESGDGTHGIALRGKHCDNIELFIFVHERMTYSDGTKWCQEMAILTDKEILRQIKLGNIVIDPFDPKNLGPNSYDVHLSPYLVVFEDHILDLKEKPKTRVIKIPPSGHVLLPGKLYLGTTLEYTETHGFVPMIEARSSVARLGLTIQMAGFGNVGFCNHWTLEMTVVHPLRIYSGASVAQLIYSTIEGEVSQPYHARKDAKYRDRSLTPVPSLIYKDLKLSDKSLSKKD